MRDSVCPVDYLYHSPVNSPTRLAGAHLCIITLCGVAVQTVGPVTLLTSCLDTYRPHCSDDQSVVRKDNDAEFIPALSNVSEALNMCLTLVGNYNHFPLLCQITLND